MFSSMHHSLVVEPWEALPGGVRVAHVDDPGRVLLLLRDQDEVTRFCASLLSAQSLSQTMVLEADADDPDRPGECNARMWIARDGGAPRFRARCGLPDGHPVLHVTDHGWGSWTLGDGDALSVR